LVVSSAVTPHLSTRPSVASSRTYSYVFVLQISLDVTKMLLHTRSSNYQSPQDSLHSQHVSFQTGGNVTAWRETQPLAQPQYHSYPTPIPIQQHPPVLQPGQYPDPRLLANAGRNLQGRWASSEQQMLWEVYQPQR